MSDHVLCISAGMLAPKKLDTPLARLHRYLNYGLLALATMLHRRNYLVRVVHGGFDEPRAFADQLASRGLLDTRFPLLLSIPSSFALAWSRAFVRAAKVISPKLQIIVGGRWVVADDGAWVRSQLPGIDLVVYGTAEARVEQLLRPDTWARVPLTDRYLLGSSPPQQDSFPGLDFGLVDSYEEFHPCVEISRGCGMGCSFCAEASVPLGDCRPPIAVVDEVASLREMYEGVIHPYFQASFFRPSSPWIQNLTSELKRRELSIEWRAETRVDGLSPAQIRDLVRAGLRVLDLGLESASPSQLQRMKKTTNVEAYLRRASELLKACDDNGVWAKVNVLLFPGETRVTVDETRAWLEQHRYAVKGVSVGPAIVFRYGASTQDYLRGLMDIGASPVAEGALDRDGYAHLHLSPEISHDAALEIANDVSREFMTEDDYFDLKAFSYFPRSFSKDQFLAISRSMPYDSLSFSTPETSIG